MFTEGVCLFQQQIHHFFWELPYEVKHSAAVQTWLSYLVLNLDYTGNQQALAYVEDAF